MKPRDFAPEPRIAEDIKNTIAVDQISARSQRGRVGDPGTVSAATTVGAKMSPFSRFLDDVESQAKKLITPEVGGVADQPNVEAIAYDMAMQAVAREKNPSVRSRKEAMVLERFPTAISTKAEVAEPGLGAGEFSNVVLKPRRDPKTGEKIARPGIKTGMTSKQIKRQEADIANLGIKKRERTVADIAQTGVDTVVQQEMANVQAAYDAGDKEAYEKAYDRFNKAFNAQSVIAKEHSMLSNERTAKKDVGGKSREERDRGSVHGDQETAKPGSKLEGKTSIPGTAPSESGDVTRDTADIMGAMVKDLRETIIVDGKEVPNPKYKEYIDNPELGKYLQRFSGKEVRKLERVLRKVSGDPGSDIHNMKRGEIIAAFAKGASIEALAKAKAITDMSKGSATRARESIPVARDKGPEERAMAKENRQEIFNGINLLNDVAVGARIYGERGPQKKLFQDDIARISDIFGPGSERAVGAAFGAAAAGNNKPIMAVVEALRVLARPGMSAEGKIRAGTPTGDAFAAIIGATGKQNPNVRAARAGIPGTPVPIGLEAEAQNKTPVGKPKMYSGLADEQTKEKARAEIKPGPTIGKAEPKPADEMTKAFEAVKDNVSNGYLSEEKTIGGVVDTRREHIRAGRITMLQARQEMRRLMNANTKTLVKAYEADTRRMKSNDPSTNKIGTRQADGKQPEEDSLTVARKLELAVADLEKIDKEMKAKKASSGTIARKQTYEEIYGSDKLAKKAGDLGHQQDKPGYESEKAGSIEAGDLGVRLTYIPETYGQMREAVVNRIKLLKGQVSKSDRALASSTKELGSKEAQVTRAAMDEQQLAEERPVTEAATRRASPGSSPYPRRLQIATERPKQSVSPLPEFIQPSRTGQTPMVTPVGSRSIGDFLYPRGRNASEIVRKYKTGKLKKPSRQTRAQEAAGRQRKLSAAPKQLMSALMRIQGLPVE